MEECKLPQICLERTLAIIKPDAFLKETDIEELILIKGYTIIQKRRVKLSPEQASEFYSSQMGQPDFPSLIQYMSSGLITVLVLSKVDAISMWKNYVGTVDEDENQKDLEMSLRGLFGTDSKQNALHASDSHIDAEREIRYFFPDTVMEPLPVKEAAKDYLSANVNPTLLTGLTELCKRKPKEPVLWLSDWLLKNNPFQPTINEPRPEIVAP